jgi:hypothetical protein
MARGREDVPQHDLDEMASALQVADDQWSTALKIASGHVGDQDPALAASIAHNIAVSMMARLAMNLNRKLRVFYGWEIIDENTVISVGNDGFIVMNGVMIDDHEPGIILMPEESIKVSGPTVAIRYNRIYRAELVFEKHGYEGWVDIVVPDAE